MTGRVVVLFALWFAAGLVGGLAVATLDASFVVVSALLVVFSFNLSKTLVVYVKRRGL